MLDYVAPVRDMQFVINELIGYERLAELAGGDELGEDLGNAILEEAAKFAREVLAPLNRVGDTEGCKHDGEATVTTPAGWREAYQAYCEAGWGSLSMNPEFGGQGLPKLIRTAVSEMWDASNMAFGLCPLLTNGAIEAIEQHGSAALQQQYLEKLISGEWSGTMNLTEPQAGSDLSTVRTRAVPEGDHYLITGQKIFITYGEHDLTENIIHLVLARLPDAPEGTRGISLFVVPKFLVNDDGSIGARNDLRCVSIEHKLGIHGSPTAVMSYGDNGGAIGYLVGEENRGLMHMFTMMNAARHAVGCEGIALGDAAYQLALGHARERVQGRAPGAGKDATILAHPDVRRMLMLMKSQVEAMRALAYHCALSYDLAEKHPDDATRAAAARRGDLLTPIVKGWSTETGQEVVSLGVQVHGGMGFVEETGAAQYYRDVRITTIYEGTTGIQAGDLTGRKTLRDGGEAMNELLAEISATLDELGGADESLNDMREALSESLGDLRSVVDWLLATAAEPALGAAAAVPYLKLAGITCGGWMMARSALLASRALAGDAADDPFYRAKIATARFYACQVMPQTAALSRSILDGARAITELDDAAFA